MREIFSTDFDMVALARHDTGAHAQLTGVFYEKPSHLPPERKLLLAILEDAINFLEKYSNSASRRKQELVQETLDWLNDLNEKYIFGFVRICDVLGLNPGAAREAIIRKVSAGPTLVNGRRKYERRQLKIPDDLDEGFSHEFVNKNHCEECKLRYNRAYRRTTAREARGLRAA